MARSRSIKFIITVNRQLGKLWEFGLRLVYDSQYRKLYRNTLKQFPKLRFSRKEIEEYKKKWGVLGHVNPIHYKLFSHHIGKNIDIVPEDLSHRVIESILNPTKFRAPFEDKNMFDKILGKEMTPQTIVRSIEGYLYDDNYKAIPNFTDSDLKKLITNNKRVVAKATLESCSGDDVLIFENKSNGIWNVLGGQSYELSIDILNKRLGKNWIVQEYLEQHEFMNRLCPTSVNTLRMLVYRSVSDNEVHLLHTGVRIGHSGSILDNSHQGGLYVALNKDGHFNNYLTDQFCVRFTKHNGLDFSKADMRMPYWENIVEFAKEVGRRIPYHRCLNLDVMLRKNGMPVLIEFNIGTMSTWLFQPNSGSCFGEFTDEIIEYCRLHKNEIVSRYLYV